MLEIHFFSEKSFYSLFKHHFPIKGPPFSRFIFDTLALINTINLFQWNWELILDNNQGILDNLLIFGARKTWKIENYSSILSNKNALFNACQKH